MYYGCGVRGGGAHLIQRRLLFLIKSIVLSSICLLTLWLNVVFPYKSIWTKELSGIVLTLLERSRERLWKRSIRMLENCRQCSRKWQVSSIPSWMLHIGVRVSSKLWWNLWALRGLSWDLSWVIHFFPSLSLIPNIYLRLGRILFSISFFKGDLRTRFLVEALRLFHFSVVYRKNDKAKLSVRWWKLLILVALILLDLLLGMLSRITLWRYVGCLKVII